MSTNHPCGSGGEIADGVGNRGPLYKDLRVNETFCRAYVEDMAALGEKVILKEDEPATASTDMGLLHPSPPPVPRNLARRPAQKSCWKSLSQTVFASLLTRMVV